MGPDVVFVVVLLVRLLVPLAIPRYPLPAILAALVIDAADQTVLQAAGATSVLDNYQSYDKALDVYYLTIAYTSVLRNWLDPAALAVARWLFYYRLVGVVAFELTGVRSLLIVFPNTFEYFFIFYEAVRLFWNPSRLRRAQLIVAAATIWIVIKLPQEFWVHIAQLDVSDIVAEHDWVAPTVAGALVALGLVAARLLPRHLPPRQWAPRVDVDAYIDRPRPAAVVPRVDARAIVSVAVLEKVLLVAMVAVIFSQILSGVRASGLELAFGVGLVVVVNSGLSLWRVRRGSRFASTAIQFGSMLGLNAAILVGLLLLSGDRGGEPVQLENTLYFLLLISLIVTLYDRYRVIGNLSSDELGLPGRRLRARLLGAGGEAAADGEGAPL